MKGRSPALSAQQPTLGVSTRQFLLLLLPASPTSSNPIKLLIQLQMSRYSAVSSTRSSAPPPGLTPRNSAAADLSEEDEEAILYSIGKNSGQRTKATDSYDSGKVRKTRMIRRPGAENLRTDERRNIQSDPSQKLYERIVQSPRVTRTPATRITATLRRR